MAATETMTRLLPDTFHVARLRRALRAGMDAPGIGEALKDDARQREIDAAAAPLIEATGDSLLRYCDSLVRGTSALAGVADGADIAQDAWTKVLRYLKSAQGERVRNDSHLFYLLRKTAKTRVLDLVGSIRGIPAEFGDIFERQTTESIPDVLQFADNDRYARVVEMLFSDENGFRRACRQPVRRRLSHYRAFILLQLGQFLFSEAFFDEPGPSHPNVIVRDMLRRYIETLGVPHDWWMTVESTVTQSAADGKVTPATMQVLLLQTINSICDAGIKPGNTVAVLRYEMNVLVNG